MTAMHACMRCFAQPGVSQRGLPLAVDWSTRRQLQPDCTKHYDHDDDDGAKAQPYY